MFQSFLISRSLVKNAGIFCKQSISRNLIANRTFTATLQRQNCSLVPKNVVSKSLMTFLDLIFLLFLEWSSLDDFQIANTSPSSHKILLKSNRTSSKSRHESCRMVARWMFWNGFRGCNFRWDRCLWSGSHECYNRDIRNYTTNNSLNFFSE